MTKCFKVSYIGKSLKYKTCLVKFTILYNSKSDGAQTFDFFCMKYDIVYSSMELIVNTDRSNDLLKFSSTTLIFV